MYIVGENSSTLKYEIHKTHESNEYMIVMQHLLRFLVHNKSSVRGTPYYGSWWYHLHIQYRTYMYFKVRPYVQEVFSTWVHCFFATPNTCFVRL